MSPFLEVFRRRVLGPGQDSGQAILVVAFAMVPLIGLAAFAVDVGYVLNSRQQLQASVDAAATAAAQELSTKTRTEVTTKATEYSAMSGRKNAYANLTGVSQTVTFKCLTTVGLTTPCTNPATSNAITVTATAVRPLFLARILGFNTMTVVASATAVMRSGTMPPLDVVIVLDTTGSMSGSPLTEAKAGIRTLLGAMWPCDQGTSPCGAATPVDKVGLMVFPGLTSAAGNVGREYDCASSPDPVIAAYGASPIYEIIPMTNDYRTSTTASLSTSSNYVKSVDGVGGCPGLEAIGGQGSYFADAIAAAQSKLASAGRSNVQDVIIFVSDGSANPYSGGPTNACQQAITAAQAARAAGTWVYSIRYYADNNADCGSPAEMKALLAMQKINSDYPLTNTGKFFNTPSGSDLTATFQKIGSDLTTTRMVPDDTP